MQTEFISLKQAAERLGLSRQRVQQIARDGRLEGAVQVGEGRRRYWIVPVGWDGKPRILSQPGKSPAREIRVRVESAATPERQIRVLHIEKSPESPKTIKILKIVSEGDDHDAGGDET